MLRLGIIGTGGIAHFHMEAYKKLGERIECVACCDLDYDKADRFAKEFGFAKVYSDCREMMAKEKLDMVSVCTWNKSHAECTIVALEGGANVLCEKPMAMNAAEAMEMEAAAEKAGKLLMIGFCRRHGNDAKMALDFIEKGFLGDVYYARTKYIRRAGCPGGWFGDKSFSGGGPLIDLGVHVIDLCRYVLGNPKPVSAFGVSYDNIGYRPNLRVPGMAWTVTPSNYRPTYNVEDFVSALITFDNGATISVETSYNLFEEGDSGEMKIFGTKGGLDMNTFNIYTDVNDNVADVRVKSFGGCGDFFANEIKHFADCVELGVPCIAPAKDGVAMMKILDAIYLSAKTGKSVDID